MMKKTYFPNAMIGPIRAGIFGLILCVQSFGQIQAIVPAGTKTSLQQACGTDHVKLVFVSQGIICFIDYSEAAPQVRAISLGTPAYFPVISPDGQWITYQTGSSSEGATAADPGAIVWMRELAVAGTPIKVADIGYVPRFVQNTSPDTPQIVYATTVRCEYPCFDSGQTVKKKIINRVPQAAEIVLPKGSFYGGLSFDNRYLCTGIPGNKNVWMMDLQNPATLPKPVHSMRVLKNVTNVDTFVTPGACNISRSASTIFTNTMMYFDFGSGAITAANCYHPLLGSWLSHGKIFISRYDGEDLKVLGLPSDVPINTQTTPPGLGEVRGVSWENPEWTNHPYFGAASLVLDRLFGKSVTGTSWEHNKTSERVYLVDFHDSTFLNLVMRTDTGYKTTAQLPTSQNIINPWIWIEKQAGFSEDPTWLSQTIWEKTDAVKNPMRDRRYAGPGGLATLLRSSVKQGRVTIFTILGEKVAEIDLSHGVTPEFERVLAITGTGMYFACISTPKSSYVLQWSRVR